MPLVAEGPWWYCKSLLKNPIGQWHVTCPAHVRWCCECNRVLCWQGRSRPGWELDRGPRPAAAPVACERPVLLLTGRSSRRQNVSHSIRVRQVSAGKVKGSAACAGGGLSHCGRPVRQPRPSWGKGWKPWLPLVARFLALSTGAAAL